MRYSYFFIVTFGRTGSTLLQGVVNTFPRTLMRGENNNFLYGLFQSWKALSDPRFRAVYGGVRNPWFGYENFSRRCLEEESVKLLRRFLLGNESELKYDCLGFKEIRYLDLPDREAFLEYMLAVFPNSAVVIHSRNPQEASESAWWKSQDKAQTLARMTDFIAFGQSFNQKHRHRTILTTHENIVGKDRSDVHRLAKFCGVKPDLEQVEKVLSSEHSVGNRKPGPGSAPAGQG